MSVNDVPGWLVTMVPSAIGEPVAFTPGLVPHCDVLTVVLPVLAAPLLEVAAVEGAADGDPLLLQPARAASPNAAASAIAVRLPVTRR